MSTPPESLPERIELSPEEMEPIALLDHGYVQIIDWMGSDKRIVDSARLSYGAGTRPVSNDRALLRYLYRHMHTSPFEQAEVQLRIKAPMFVVRQWVRHRTACLSGESTLYFDLPSAANRGAGKRHNVTIKEFHRMWHEGTAHPIGKHKPPYLDKIEKEAMYSINQLSRLVDRRPETLRNMIREGQLDVTRREGQSPNQPSLYVQGKAWHHWAENQKTARVNKRARLASMHLRSCDELTGQIIHTRIKDIWESGVKPVFKVTLENGNSLTMSKDHRCLTEEGWKTLQEASRLVISRDTKVSWSAHAPALAVNGVAMHSSKEWLLQCRQEEKTVGEMAEISGVSYYTIRKHLKKQGLQFTAAERSRLSEQRSKSLPAGTQLMRGYSEIANIEYVGEEMTYDLEVEGPYHNFVADGFIVHNSMNEMSGRYSILPDEFYVPGPERVQVQSQDNKQGSGQALQQEIAADLSEKIRASGERDFALYNDLLDHDVARELARVTTPVSTYTDFVWKQNLKNLLHLLMLRADTHAQYEIRVYAEAIGSIVEKLFPLSWEAFVDYQQQSKLFTRLDLETLSKLFAHLELEVEEGQLKEFCTEVGLTNKREQMELFEKMRNISIGFGSSNDAPDG